MGCQAGGIIELDSNGDLLLTASHPMVADAELNVLKSRSGLIHGKDASLTPFVCSRYGSSWHHILTTDASPATRAVLPMVDRLSVFVITKDFNPEKYKELCSVISRLYTKTGNSVHLMKVFVQVMLKQSYDNSEESIAFKSSNYDPRRALIASPLKGLIEAIPDDFTLVWLAMLMRRRIFLLARSPEDALAYIRSMPLLVWHRSTWAMLRPLVTHTEEEKEDLLEAGIFCAGIVGGDHPLPRSITHDLFVNVMDGRVDVTHTGADLMAFSQIQYVKDTCSAVTDCAHSENDQAVIKMLASKTKDLLGKVEKLRQALPGDQFSVEGMAKMELPTGMPQFIYSLAVAEGKV